MGPLEPVFAEPDPKKGYVITHKCQKCGGLSRNRAAYGVRVQPDDISLLIALTVKKF
jgi:hypothetical protein